jgi:hypothetical protein
LINYLMTYIIEKFYIKIKDLDDQSLFLLIYAILDEIVSLLFILFKTR